MLIGLGLNALFPDDGMLWGDAEPLEVGPSWKEWAVEGRLGGLQPGSASCSTMIES